MPRLVAALTFFAVMPAAAMAQGNYEIQVYGSDLVPPHQTMFELHSNFTVEGSKTVVDGMLPTEHQEHETLEITHGFNDWFETGFYLFNNIQPGGGWMWAGTHIRPRIAVPERYGLPVGLSLSTEVGYQRPLFSADTWTWEIRPIVDKKLGRWYAAFNPALERSLHGPSVRKGVEFSPDCKVSYDFSSKVAGGFEYYAALGPVTGFDPFYQQQQQFLPAIDLNLNPKFEFNFGVGVGATRGTDHLLVKMILGYRFKL
jgi:hypothetical protein